MRLQITDLLRKGLIHAMAEEGGESSAAPSAPAAAPTEAAPTAPEPVTASSDAGDSDASVWEGLDEAFDVEVDEGSPSPSGVALAPAPKAPAASAPVAPATATAATPPSPTSTPPAPQAPATAPRAAAPQASQPTPPAQPPVDAAALEQQAFNELVARYQIPKEEVETLALQPEVVIPKLAARMALDMQRQTMQALQHVVPQMIQQVQAQREVSRQNEETFFQAWPALRGQEARIMQVGRVYRQLNPQATKEDFVRDVGAQVAVSLGIPLQAPPQQQSAPQAPPPYRAPRGGAAVPPPKQSEWDTFIETFDADE